MIPTGTKVYFAVAPTDLRKSFDGLSALASGQLQKDPSEGGLFVFLNKRGDQVCVLFWDRHGCCVLAKRRRVGSTPTRGSDTGSGVGTSSQIRK